MIDVKKIKLPKDLKTTPKIDWGADFEDFDDARKIRYLKIFSSAMNHAADKIQQERNELLVTLNDMKIVLENADQAVTIQKAIVLKAITGYNSEKQELISRIQELENTVKIQDATIEILNNGDNGRLSH